MVIFASHRRLCTAVKLFSAATFTLPLKVFAEDLAAKSAAAPMPVAPSIDVAGMVGSLLFVIVCIVGLTWLLRRSRLVSTTGQAGVKLVSQIPLSMKEKLLVVQVGDEKLLIGCTATAINTLHCWASSPDDESDKPAESPFAKLLAKRQMMAPLSKANIDLSVRGESQ
ncbi:flagellar biosynthetic protein FliO [Zhongshania arctica]|uniref:Flagellar protein n=1 Tax=Zhongshania arctica TaxID=3238302 RepID=A0ABV3TWS2_9GAMM